MTFFTSDTHFFHDNVIEFCKRPFTDVYHMNWMLVQNWNARVGPEDTVYHLGDLSFKRQYKAEEIKEILRVLNGKKYLVPGNHDYPNPQQYEEFFEILPPYVNLLTQGMTIQLGHMPPETIDSMGKLRPLVVGADYFLCGHVHSAWGRRGNVINCGVDVRDYAPTTLEELIASE